MDDILYNTYQIRKVLCILKWHPSNVALHNSRKLYIAERIGGVHCKIEEKFYDKCFFEQ